MYQANCFFYRNDIILAYVTRTTRHEEKKIIVTLDIDDEYSKISIYIGLVAVF